MLALSNNLSELIALILAWSSSSNSTSNQSLIGGKKSKKDRLVDYYMENVRKSKLNTYLMRFMVLISVLFILMGSRVFMNNRSLNRDLQEARVQSQSRDTRQVQTLQVTCPYHSLFSLPYFPTFCEFRIP